MKQDPKLIAAAMQQVEEHKAGRAMKEIALAVQRMLLIDGEDGEDEAPPALRLFLAANAVGFVARDMVDRASLAIEEGIAEESRRSAFMLTGLTLLARSIADGVNSGLNGDTPLVASDGELPPVTSSGGDA
jgi:hypothetical protein